MVGHIFPCVFISTRRPIDRVLEARYIVMDAAFVSLGVLFLVGLVLGQLLTTGPAPYQQSIDVP